MKRIPRVLACWKDTIAVSSEANIIILNAITGSQVAVLSGHIDWVESFTFSLGGALLGSGSSDKTAKLWDLQTGGVIKTFRGHNGSVRSISISPDNTTLASGSQGGSIHLWSVLTGKCFCVIHGHSSWVNSVSFSPVNSQHLISSSNDRTVKQWDINGCQIGGTHIGHGVAFSLDGTHFVSWWGKIATVRNSKSGVVVIKLQAPFAEFHCCCFSPSGEFMAGVTGHTIHIWDIVHSDPHPFKTLVGHRLAITALTFSSHLISASRDGSVKFWQIGEPPLGPVTTDKIPTPPTSALILSVSLQARNGIAISSDSDGVVKTWDILTGLCKASFQTPARGRWRDAQLIEDKLVFVWYLEQKIYIWDTKKNKLFRTVDASVTQGLRISGDGSKVFCLTRDSIQAWCMWTGEAVGKVEFEYWAQYLDPLHTDGSRIWVHFFDSPIEIKGWDFGILGSSPIPLSGASPNKPHLNFILSIDWLRDGPSRIEDTAAGTNVFQLLGRYAAPCETCWDGQYLVAGYKSGEVLILDFNCLSRHM